MSAKRRPKTDISREGLARMALVCASLLVLQIGLYTGVLSGIYGSIRAMTAASADALLGWLGYSSVVAGFDVALGPALVTVTDQCIPLSGIVVGVVILMTEDSLTRIQQLTWSALLLTVILAANIGRIALVLVMMWNRNPATHFVHVYVLTLAFPVLAMVMLFIAIRVSGRATPAYGRQFPQGR